MLSIHVLAASFTVVTAVIVLVIVALISKAMKRSFFDRFFRVLQLAFLFPVFGRTIVALDYAYGFLQGYGVQLTDVDLVTNFVTSSLLAVAFITLYFDWSEEPIVDGSPEPFGQR